ncbi:MAG: hypothetical protein A2048_09915 [Deltaproteobacteria bacterium GWA2_45_12]|nr:MAG: hypothetical protein A2048_09915 [Deltaproteobacteria bacterium GWA2_45_12]
MYYLFYKVHNKDIAMIKFLIEAYENMMDISTIDRNLPKIQISCAKDYLDDCKAIIADLQTRFEMIKLDEPHDRSQGNY